MKQQLEAVEVKTTETEKRKREDDSEHDRARIRDVISESKKANVKIGELHRHIKQRVQWEEQLKSDIELLKNKVSDINLTVDDEKAEKQDLLKLYSQSKDRIVELEERD